MMLLLNYKRYLFDMDYKNGMKLICPWCGKSWGGMKSVYTPLARHYGQKHKDKYLPK